MVIKTRAFDRAEAESDSRLRTLVVDDSPFLLKVLAQILKETGNFDLVGTATDGCQALRYVSLLSPDLVLMDVHMPRLNGIQATRYIKQLEHPPAIIIVTSDDSPVTKAMAEEAGADGFVSKDGNLRQQMIGALQDLFGPNGARRAKTRNTVNKNRRSPNKTSETSPGNFTTHERFDPALDVAAIQATGPSKTTSPCGTPFLGSAQYPQDARTGSSTPSDAPSTSQLLAPANHSRNCALPHEFGPPERRATNTRHHENTKTTRQH